MMCLPEINGKKKDKSKKISERSFKRKYMDDLLNVQVIEHFSVLVNKILDRESRNEQE